MKQTFIIRNNGKHLLLFFAGWGMDETPFRHIHPAECDWMICYDYRSLEFDTTLIQAYSKITLIAWSMGVWAASQVMKQYPSLPVSQSTAINGTLYPIHETEGITPSVFEGTLQGLNEQTLLKFQRRMCGSAADYKVFQTMAPKRPSGSNTCHPSLRSLSGRQPSSEITTGFSFRTIKSRHGATRQTPSCTSKLPIISRSFLMR